VLNGAVMAIRGIARRATRAADHVAAVRKPLDRRLEHLTVLVQLRRDVDEAIRTEIASLRADKVPAARVAEAALMSRTAVNKQIRVARQRAQGGTDHG
jgi:hypothetical protein